MALSGAIGLFPASNGSLLAGDSDGRRLDARNDRFVGFDHRSVRHFVVQPFVSNRSSFRALRAAVQSMPVPTERALIVGAGQAGEVAAARYVTSRAWSTEALSEEGQALVWALANRHHIAVRKFSIKVGEIHPAAQPVSEAELQTDLRLGACPSGRILERVSQVISVGRHLWQQYMAAADADWGPKRG
jgi:hypothetical protein